MMEKGSEKKVGGDEEDDAGIVDAAHVDDGEEDEDPEAEREGVRLKGGYGGDEGADSGGDSDGRCEHVVDHEGRRGEQAGGITEVLAGNGEGAAAVGIGFDGLRVGEVEDDEEDEDGGGDGADEMNAAEAERDEEGEGSFRSVGGGAEGVKAEDGDTGGGTDMFRAFFRGGQRAAKEQVGDLHEGKRLVGDHYGDIT